MQLSSVIYVNLPNNLRLSLLARGAEEITFLLIFSPTPLTISLLHLGPCLEDPLFLSSSASIVRIQGSLASTLTFCKDIVCSLLKYI